MFHQECGSMAAKPSNVRSAVPGKGKGGVVGLGGLKEFWIS